MDTLLFAKALLIGISIAAPVGPVGLLCVQRTLNGGRMHGLASGLGAATADTLYGSVAAFGMVFISHFLVEHRFWLGLIGGSFLIGLGLHTLRMHPQDPTRVCLRVNHWHAYISTFLLTLTNPMTVLAFLAIYAGLGMTEIADDYTSAGLVVLGVFSGSVLWWFFLSLSVSMLRGSMRQNQVVWVNRISGAIITLCGVLAIASLVFWDVFPKGR